MYREERTRNRRKVNFDQSSSKLKIPAKLKIPVKVKTLEQIIEAIKKFQPKTGTLHRKAIEEGFKDIEKQTKMLESVNYGGDDDFKPAKIPSGPKRHWVDGFIEEDLGGYRDGLIIKWELEDGTIWCWDPFTDRLTEES